MIERLGRLDSSFGFAPMVIAGQVEVSLARWQKKRHKNIHCRYTLSLAATHEDLVMKYWGSATRDHGLLTAGVPLDESLAESCTFAASLVSDAPAIWKRHRKLREAEH
jgi:hypothetical protein